MVMTTEKIWEEFHPRIKQFILKRIPDEHNAEDLLQEVFLKIHARIDTLRDEEKLQSWMYQIARNVIADYYRQHKATVALAEALLLPEEPVVDDHVFKHFLPVALRMFD